MEHISENVILNQLKKNDRTFRSRMEQIFQKYSNLEDSGHDVCLKSMTLTSGKGSVPLNSVTAEKELQHLRNQLKKRSLPALNSPQKEYTVLDPDVTSSSYQMDVSMEELDHSRQMENSTSGAWRNSETTQLSPQSMRSSRSCLWAEPSQPEEEDQDLERTLNSNGSTLLSDVYPSMLSQLGEACRRQHATKVARSVLRRYRRRRWESSQAQHRGRASSDSHNPALTRMSESGHTAPTPVRNKIANHQKSRFVRRGSAPHRSPVDVSPMKSSSNASHVSTACFYSSRRDGMEKGMQVDNGPVSNHESPRCRPVRVLDLSTPPSPGSPSHRSPSPDLNQTYVVEPVPLPRSNKFPDSGATWSPLKMARMASASRSCSVVNSLPSYHRRNHDCSTTDSPQKDLASHQYRGSPLKPSSTVNRPLSSSYPKPALPMSQTSEVCQSPYQGHRYPSSHQANPSHQLKRQRSFPSHCPSSPSTSRMPSRQIDAEFMRLYHHFICRSTNSTSCCHVCKRRSGAQSPDPSSTSMFALSLTPVRSRVKKRHRESEVTESLRFKRFRESCSPRRTPQIWPTLQQQERHDSYANSAMEQPGEDKYTWNRALFLQCPSPGFLGAIRQSGSGSNGRRPGSRLDTQTRHYSPSWKELFRSRGEGGHSEGSRPTIRTWDQSGVSFSPRRRLLSDF